MDTFGRKTHVFLRKNTYFHKRGTERGEGLSDSLPPIHINGSVFFVSETLGSCLSKHAIHEIEYVCVSTNCELGCVVRLDLSLSLSLSLSPKQTITTTTEYNTDHNQIQHEETLERCNTNQHMQQSKQHLPHTPF